MNVITLSEAKLQGIVHYYTGIPCSKGHVAPRLVSDRSCAICNREKRAKYYNANPEKYRAERKVAYRKNAEKEKAVAKIRSAEWRKANPCHEGSRLTKRRYKKSSAGRALGSKYLAARRTGMKQAVPVWADLTAIGDVYIEAQHMQMQVDHIVPLRNKLVCGLHVWDNLQLLDATANNRKGNRHWPDMPA